MPNDIPHGGAHADSGIRQHLEVALDPDDPADQVLVMVYLAGRADMVNAIQAGFEQGERPGYVFARAAQADAALAARFGVKPTWGTDLTPEQAAAAPIPSIKELLKLRKRLI